MPSLDWQYAVLLLNPCVRQLTNKIGATRVKDAWIKGVFSFPLEDKRYSLQTRGLWGTTKIGGLLSSPEWMLSVTSRAIVKRPQAMGCMEYVLTGSNYSNSLVPKGLKPVDYLWWRLEHYFEITRSDSCLFTDDLLADTLKAAEWMFQ